MAESDSTTLVEERSIIDRVRRYLQLQESPEFKPCPRCNGKGYHHGFGEHGHDPDWCEDCGGPGEVMVDDWEDGDELLKDVLAHLEAKCAHDPEYHGDGPIYRCVKCGELTR